MAILTIESTTPARIAHALETNGWKVRDFVVNSLFIKGERERSDGLEGEITITIHFTQNGAVRSAHVLNDYGYKIDDVPNGNHKAARTLTMIERHGNRS